MKKLIFNLLSIELTRECNMTPPCKHCFRGDAQSLKIKTEYIDQLLDQTEAIGLLHFTGGEPMMCIDTMTYIYNQLCQRNIPIYGLYIITNGLVADDDAISIIKKYSELIMRCRKAVTKQFVYIKKFVVVGISLDRYHSHASQVQVNLNKFKTALKDYARVFKFAQGNLPELEGRGKMLNDGLRISHIETTKKTRIEILDAKHKPICPEYTTYFLARPDQILICCGIYLDCHGYIMSQQLGSHEYKVVDDPENHICRADEPIYEAIAEYNKGRVACLTQLKQEVEDIKKHPFNLDRIHDALYRLSHIDEDDSDSIPFDSGKARLIKMASTNLGVIDKIMAEAVAKDYLKSDQNR